MASLLVYGGRALFFSLTITQSIILAVYLATYKADSSWYAVASLQSPSVAMWLGLVLYRAAKLQRLFLVWILYTVGLVISIAMVFGFVGDSLDKERFLGPIVLKSTLCITPLLLLLILNTAKDVKDHRELVSMLSFYMAVNLFDIVEMLDIVLDEKEHKYGIPNAFGEAMVIFACISLLLSPWQMMENNLEKRKPRKYTAIGRNIAEIVFNLVFMIFRLVVVFKYKKDESIFIAKNGIGIIISIFHINNLLKHQLRQV